MAEDVDVENYDIYIRSVSRTGTVNNKKLIIVTGNYRHGKI